MAYEVFDERPPWEGLAAYEAPETEPEGPSGEFPEEEEEYQDLEATYVLLPEEPGYDQLYDQAGDWLEMEGGMLDQFNIFPVNIS